eukprot:474221-Lingulodinium_polyedra.AAC.1
MTDASDLLAPDAVFCTSCYVWLNSAEQRVEHVAGKKHRKNARLALQPRFCTGRVRQRVATCSCYTR